MLSKQIQAEEQLATALGWRDLVDCGGTLLGAPPYDSTNSRGQATVPKWSRDWSACGPLLSCFDIAIEGFRFNGSAEYAVASYGTDDHQFLFIPVTEWPTRDDALRYAITMAAFIQLADRRGAPRAKAVTLIKSFE